MYIRAANLIGCCAECQIEAGSRGRRQRWRGGNNVFAGKLTSLLPTVLSYDSHAAVRSPRAHETAQQLFSPRRAAGPPSAGAPRALLTHAQPAVGELAGFNHARLVISGATVYASIQSQRDLTAPSPAAPLPPPPWKNGRVNPFGGLASHWPRFPF